MIPKYISIKKLPLALASVAVVLIVWGALTAKFAVGFYGLFESFPVVYYVGLSLLGLVVALTLISDKPSRVLLMIQLLVFVSAIWLIPVFIGAPPGLPMAYYNLGHINNISEQGMSYAFSGIPYLAWPGFHILFGAVTSWFNVNLEPLLNVYPFIIQMLSFPLLFVFLRNMMGKEKERGCWVGLWIFTLANWVGQDYFSPQSLAILLLMAILAVVTLRLFWEGRVRTRVELGILLLCLFGCLVITHVLTSIAVLCLLGAYFLVKKWKMLAVVVVCAALVILWDSTLGAHYIHMYVEQQPLVVTGVDVVDDASTFGMMRRTTDSKGVLVLDPEYIIETNIIGSLSGSDSHIAVVKARILYAGLFVLLTIGGVVFALFDRRKRTHIAMLVMALSLFSLLLLKYAGWEVMQRVYLFGLPFVAYFIGLLLSANKRWAVAGLAVFLVVCVPLFIICRYGNQASDYFSEDYIAGYHYVEELQDTSDYALGTLRGIDVVDGEVVLRHYTGKKNLTFGYFPMDHYYFAISKHDDAMYTYIYDKPDFVDTVWEWFKESPNNVSVYKNPEYEVFKWQSP